MQVRRCFTFLVVVVSLACFTTGCRKKVDVAPPPPPAPAKEVTPPPPSAPTASLTAEPAAIEPGQSVTLKWSTTDATEATVSGIGTVEIEGRQEVRPEKSVTYELVAKGPGGSATATASVNVIVLPPVVAPSVESKSLLERIATELSDAYFDYDRSDIREDARAALAKNAEALRSILADFPDAVIVLEGHCDERGSAEYNLGLGDRRVASASAYLAGFGIEAIRLQTVSYGKERPQCIESTETCWQSNRRVHFAAGTSGTN